MIRMLVIEDNPADVELLRMALTQAGLECEITVVDDGGQALAHVKSVGGPDVPVPDLMMLDLNLPKNDGLEILEAARSNPALAKVLIAVLSSSSSPRDLARLEKFQIDRYITKPVDLEEYLSIGTTVKDMLARDVS